MIRNNYIDNLIFDKQCYILEQKYMTNLLFFNESANNRYIVKALVDSMNAAKKEIKLAKKYKKQNNMVEAKKCLQRASKFLANTNNYIKSTDEILEYL